MRPSKDEKLRILVSGASGVYGAHFAKYALDLGHEIFSIRHAHRPYDTASLLGISDRITWLTGDIRDSGLLSQIFAVYDIGFVAHFAALPLVGDGTLVAEPIFSTNVMGTVSILEAVKQISLKRPVNVLMCSTDKVYGNAGDRPYTEDMPLLGSSVYEASKVAAEAACRAYQMQGYVPNLVVSRICNIIASCDFHWRLISNTIRQFISNVPARIFTRGQMIREYIPVDSAVEAQFQIMLRADEPEYMGQAFNIGSGRQFTQEQMILHIRDTHFPEGQITRVEPPAYHRIEIPFQRLDTKKIESALGWKPQKTPETSIAEVVSWWQTHKELAPWSML